MVRLQRGIAVGPSEDRLDDPTSFELASGDTIAILAPSQGRDDPGAAPSRFDRGSASAGGVSGSDVSIVVPAADRDGTPAAPLAREMSEAWRRGDCRAVEDLLARHPELRDDATVVDRLISEEIRLRCEYGQEVVTAEFVRRFPQRKTRVVEL